MESKESAQWSSIVVPSVQEMVKEKMVTTVPPRYVRPDQDKTEVTDRSGLNTEIPIIDMKRLCSSTTMDSEVEKLDFACKEWGFFQVNSPNFLLCRSTIIFIYYHVKTSYEDFRLVSSEASLRIY